MELIKLLDIANPKNVKDTINTLIENYEGFHDDISAIANQASEDAASAQASAATAQSLAEAAQELAASAQASAESAEQSAIQANASAEAASESAEEAITTANTAVTTANTASAAAQSAVSKSEEAIASAQTANITAATAVETANIAEANSEQAVITANAANATADEANTTADSANATAAEALGIVNIAASDAAEAVETAELALQNANDATETSELAMNIATEAKSTVDQAISTGVFGTFVHNTQGMSLLHAYMTHNLDQQDTDENFYMATPKLVRDALVDYYNKTTIDELEVELQTAITQEITQREAAVNTLQTTLNTEVTERQNAITTVQSALNEEINARTTAVTNIQADITTLNTALTTKLNKSTYQYILESFPNSGGLVGGHRYLQIGSFPLTDCNTFVEVKSNYDKRYNGNDDAWKRYPMYEMGCFCGNSVITGVGERAYTIESYVQPIGDSSCLYYIVDYNSVRVYCDISADAHVVFNIVSTKALTLNLTSIDALPSGATRVPSTNATRLAAKANATTVSTLQSNISTINTQLSALEGTIATKVTQEEGKGLSTEDYTTDEKNKLSGIEAGAQVNPTTLPNPSALIIKQDGTTLGSYDGSSATEVNIPASQAPIDSALSTTSENPVQNKTVTEAINSAKRNIGEIVTSTIPLTDAGLHLLDGSTLTLTGPYSAFVAYMLTLHASGEYTDIFISATDYQTSITQYGVCGKFVCDSTNGIITLPKIEGITEATVSVSTLGAVTEAGLPNITGNIISGAWNTDAKKELNNGAFSSDDVGTIASASGQDARALASFDASRSSAIYGKSNTVQPQTVKVLYYIVVANKIKTEITADIDNILSTFNTKANTDGSNIDSTSFINNLTVLKLSLAEYGSSGIGIPTSQGAWRERRLGTIAGKTLVFYQQFEGDKNTTQTFSGGPFTDILMAWTESTATSDTQTQRTTLTAITSTTWSTINAYNHRINVIGLK